MFIFHRYGEDYTRATLQCIGKGGVYIDSLQPDSLARIRELESYTEQPIPQTPVLMEAPKFVTQLSDITQLKEGQSAHFEARLTPVNDANLTVSGILLIQYLIFSLCAMRDCSSFSIFTMCRSNGTIMIKSYRMAIGTVLSTILV